MTTLARLLRPALPHPLELLRQSGQTVLLWSRRRRDRANLRVMDEHMLRDIGLDRLSARVEADKPFWRD